MHQADGQAGRPQCFQQVALIPTARLTDDLHRLRQFFKALINTAIPAASFA